MKRIHFILHNSSFILSAILLTGCATDNRRLTPGGSGWQSSYTMDLKRGTFAVDNAKDNSIKKLEVVADSNGVQRLTIENMENRINADAVQGATQTTAMLAEIIRAQGQVNAEYMRQIGGILGTLANYAAAGATGRPPAPIPPVEPIAPLPSQPSAIPSQPSTLNPHEVPFGAAPSREPSVPHPATPSPPVAAPSPQPRITLSPPPAPSEVPKTDTPILTEHPRTDTPVK